MSEHLDQRTSASGSAGQLEKDPVCGMSVDSATAKHVHQHAGKSYYFCCGHCAEKFKSAPEKYLSHPAATNLISLGTPPQAEGVELARDPVCGMNVNPTTAKFVTEKEGKPYYFCSRGCLEKFVADPAMHLSKLSSGAMTAREGPKTVSPEPGGARAQTGRMSVVRNGLGAGSAACQHTHRVHLPDASGNHPL